MREQSQYEGLLAKKERALLKVLAVVQEEEISGRPDKESSLQAECPTRAEAGTPRALSCRPHGI